MGWFLATSFFVLLFFMPFTMTLAGDIGKERRDIKVSVRPPFLPFPIVFRKMPGSLHLRKKPTNKPDKPTEGLNLDYKNLIKLFPKAFKTLGRGFSFNRFETLILLGTGDAAATALLCGAVDASLKISLKNLKRYLWFERKPEIQVKPHYGEALWNLSLDVSVSSTLIRSLSAALRVYRILQGEKEILKAND